METGITDKILPNSGTTRKRNRVILNCLNCKRRKVKCDRQLPCLRCIKSGLTCEYQQPEWNHNASSDIAPFKVQRLGGVSPNSNQTTNQSELQELKERIRQLENKNNNSNNSYSIDNGNLPLKRQTSMSHATSKEQINNYKYDPNNNATFIGINPYADISETINFYKDYNSIHVSSVTRKYNAGPFSWLALMKKDPALLQSWKKFRQQRSAHLQKLRQVSRNGKEPPSAIPLPKFENNEAILNPEETNKTNSLLPSVQDAEEDFRAKAIDRDGFNDVRLYGNIQRTSNLRSKITKKSEKNETEENSTKIATMNKQGISLGLTIYEGTIDKELQLIEKISMVLPKQKVVWKLVNKFFAKVYPFMPIIDETEFKTEISKIVGPEEYDETDVELTVEKRLDFAYLGILLTILRLTYLSLFLNRNGVNEDNLNTTDPSEEAQELKYLLSNPINITVTDVAQECLEQFDFLRKTNFTVLQCTFLLRLYCMFAPEDGDGADVGDSQTYNAMLIQMAYSMGINREPTTNISHGQWDILTDDLKMNNVQRKIWFFLVICDLIQGYKFGNPLCIDKKYYDTALPFYKPGNENIQDVEMEKHVIGTFSYFERYYEKLVTILDSTLDIKKDIKLSELTSQLTDFEVFLANNYGSLKDFLIPYDSKVYKYSFVKTMKCKNYINMRMFLNTIFYHLFLYYEKQQNTEFAFFYLKKVLASHLGEFFPNIFYLINDNHVNFGEVADLILNPTVESMIHKVSQINFALIVRLNSSFFSMRNNPKHAEKMDSDAGYRKKFAKISQAALRLRKVSDFLLMAMSKLSRRYYYAWRVTKALSFILKYANREELYSNQINQVNFLDINDEQLTELTNMIGISLERNSKARKLSDGDIDIPSTTAATEEVRSNCTLETVSTLGTNTNVFTNPTISSSTSKHPQDVIDPISMKPINVDSLFDNFDWEKDLNIINNPEIDNLWLQMAQMKNDSSHSTINNNNNNNYNMPINNNTSNSAFINLNNNGNSIGSANPITPSSVTSSNSEGDYIRPDRSTRLSSDFGLFDTLPFERFFGGEGM